MKMMMISFQCFPEGTDMTSILDFYFQVHKNKPLFPNFSSLNSCSLPFKILLCLMSSYLCPSSSAVLHRGDLRERQRHGGDSGQWRLLPHHGRARAEPRGGAKHPESNALLRHVRLFRPVRLPCQFPPSQLLFPQTLSDFWLLVTDLPFPSSRSGFLPNLASLVAFCWLFPM